MGVKVQVHRSLGEQAQGWLFLETGSLSLLWDLLTTVSQGLHLP